MEEESKYYTPEPEEFRMGFEYEISTREGTWLKDTYMCNSKVGVTFDDMPELAKISRVKLLDKSDIEDLGWKRHEDTDRYDNNPYMMIFREGKMYIHRIAGEALFQGTIKNKNRLQDVLKMIGI